jgi:DNA-binding MarR family transcriptional regulator
VELRYLLYFATVAEQQSFTRAAEKLRIAQSSISQQIKTLEEELEVKLLLRTKRSVKLTAAGHAFLREANDIELFVPGKDLLIGFAIDRAPACDLRHFHARQPMPRMVGVERIR